MTADFLLEGVSCAGGGEVVEGARREGRVE